MWFECERSIRLLEPRYGSKSMYTSIFSDIPFMYPLTIKKEIPNITNSRGLAQWINNKGGSITFDKIRFRSKSNYVHIDAMSLEDHHILGTSKERSALYESRQRGEILVQLNYGEGWNDINTLEDVANFFIQCGGKKYGQIVVRTKVFEDSCSICLEQFASDDYIEQLGCGHRFHKKCIEKWREQRNICPVCKAKIMISDVVWSDELPPSSAQRSNSSETTQYL